MEDSFNGLPKMVYKVIMDGNAALDEVYTYTEQTPWSKVTVW